MFLEAEISPKKQKTICCPSMHFEVKSPHRKFLAKLGYSDSQTRPIMLESNSERTNEICFDSAEETELASILDDILQSDYLS